MAAIFLCAWLLLFIKVGIVALPEPLAAAVHAVVQIKLMPSTLTGRVTIAGIGAGLTYELISGLTLFFLYAARKNGGAILEAALLLLLGNVALFLVMVAVGLLGTHHPLSHLLVYGPIIAITVVSFRDHISIAFVCSIVLGMGHGLAHIIYPFLDQVDGVNHSVDVWQDQFLHLGQALLFSGIFWPRSGPAFKRGATLLVCGNIVNVMAGFKCWGQFCHALYVNISIFPALAAGLHFAAGCLFQNRQEVTMAGFAIQGTSSVLTYFLFRSSDDILKVFAQCRFFEVYSIAPHYVGYFFGRHKLHSTADKQVQRRRSTMALEQVEQDMHQRLDLLASPKPTVRKEAKDGLLGKIRSIEMENLLLKQQLRGSSARGIANNLLIQLGIAPGEYGSNFLPTSKWKHACTKMRKRSYFK